MGRLFVEPPQQDWYVVGVDFQISPLAPKVTVRFVLAIDNDSGIEEGIRSQTLCFPDTVDGHKRLFDYAREMQDRFGADRVRTATGYEA